MKVYRFDEINSTNTFFKEIKKVENYDCAIAQKQSAGVGRRGNKWVSELGMALFSFVLLEDEIKEQSDYSKLPLIVGIAVLRALNKIENLEYKYKWTNDIYLNDRKISGILVEKVKNYFIIGIGINVNNTDYGYVGNKAISLREVTSSYYNIEDIIFCIIDECKKNIFKMNNGEWIGILEEINRYNYLKDKEIIVEKYGEIIGEGIAKNIDFDGKLIVEIKEEERKFDIGEIHIKNDR